MHRVINFSVFRRFLELAIVASLGLASCGKSRPARTDDDLIAVFRQNRAAFDRLIAISFASTDCVSKGSSICEAAGSKAVVSELSSRLGLPIEAAYIKRNLLNSLWLPVESYGPWSMSSSSRGYVYCKCSLEPLTQNTLEALGQGTNGVWYRPVESGWMLFAVR
jgi:hypothetical protein